MILPLRKVNTIHTSIHFQTTCSSYLSLARYPMSSHIFAQRFIAFFLRFPIHKLVSLDAAKFISFQVLNWKMLRANQEIVNPNHFLRRLYVSSQMANVDHPLLSGLSSMISLINTWTQGNKNAAFVTYNIRHQQEHYLHPSDLEPKATFMETIAIHAN